MNKVYNKHHGDAPSGAIFIGRGSPYGNNYSHMKGTLAQHKVATREDAIRRYEEEKSNDPEFLAMVKRELRDKDLLCFCKPLACHGDFLIKIANENDS